MQMIGQSVVFRIARDTDEKNTKVALDYTRVVK